MCDVKNNNNKEKKDMYYFDSTPWLTIKEACKYLKCGRTKIQQLITDGDLKSYRLDKKRRSIIRILKRDINQYMLFNKKIRLSKSEKELLTIISE